MSARLLLLPGDGIGPEVMAQAERVLECLKQHHGFEVEWRFGLIGGAAIDVHNDPLPAATLEAAQAADATLLGAVGGPKWEAIERALRPERGLLRIRAEMGLYANLRPAMLFSELAAASSLRPELVAGLDILIVRELTGGIYFGQPRGIREEN
ncbi:MAG: isocitrate/isopropylmalate family dehydrogenase, partial [Proteobacteria bacterium]|nr:isocitrate/isopropylmalate family dehydrogenase [Pseudomonadota bacterium]